MTKVKLPDNHSYTMIKSYMYESGLVEHRIETIKSETEDMTPTKQKQANYTLLFCVGIAIIILILILRK